MTNATAETKRALLITSLAHADQGMFTEAAQRAEAQGDPVLARACLTAAHNFEAIASWLEEMVGDLQAGQVEDVVTQVQTMLKPIHALNENEPILTSAVADLAQPYAALLAVCPDFQLPRHLMTDDESLANLSEVATAVEDQIQELQRRIAERRQLLAGRNLAASSTQPGGAPRLTRKG